MDLNAKMVLLNINNESPFFKMPTQISFFEDFTFTVNGCRIEISYEGQTFFFRHPPPAQRQFSVQPKSTKITLRNLVLQNFDNGRYTNRHTLDLYLEFNELTTAADFTMGLLAHHYREQ